MRSGKCVFLAQEQALPYPYVVSTLSDEGVDYARAKNQPALSLLLRCQEEDKFVPYGLEGSQTIELGDLY